MNRIVIVMVMMAGGASYGIGTLQIGQVTVEEQQVVVPVYLEGDVGSGVSSMDFRLKYNPDALQPLSAMAGEAAATADKQVLANAKAGEYVVVMMGMNQKSLQSGEVARIVLRRLDAGGGWGLGLSDPSLSGPDGMLMPSRVAPYDGENGSEAVEPEKPVPASKPDSVQTQSRSANQPPMAKDTEPANVPQRAATAIAPTQDPAVRIAAALNRMGETRTELGAPGTAAGGPAATEAADEASVDEQPAPLQAADHTGELKHKAVSPAGDPHDDKFEIAAVQPVSGMGPASVSPVASNGKGRAPWGTAGIAAAFVAAAIGLTLVAGKRLLR